MKTCLDCKWLARDAVAPGWHQCGWPAPVAIPRALQVVHVSVSLTAPFRDCATWEAIGNPAR